MPNSVLWVGLVAIWLFVLVPMFIKGRPEVTKTTDAVRQTRLLARGGSSRRTSRGSSRGRVAAGEHPHDATYQQSAKGEAGKTVAYDEETVEMKKVPPVTVDAELVDAESVDNSADDVEAEDDSIVDAELEDGSDDVTEVIDVVADDAEDEAGADDDSGDVDEYDDDAEYDDLVDDDDDDDAETVAAEDGVGGGADGAKRKRTRPRGRGGYNPEVDKTRGHTRYRERQRVLIGLLAVTLLAVGAGVVFGLFGWVATGVAAVVLVTYLAYLRRAVRTESQIRRQRMSRLERSRREADVRRRREIAEPELAERIPRRLRRPGSVVLEIDDEDPTFEHLPPFQRRRVMREDEEFRRVG